MHRRLNRAALAFVLGLAAFGSGIALAQETKAKSAAPAGKSEKVDVEKGSLLDQMQLLDTAATLIRHGRETKDADALIVAAKILSKVTTQEFSKKIAEKKEEFKLKAADLKPEALFEEAAKLGGDKAYVKESIAAAKTQISEVQRGRIQGPFSLIATMNALEEATAPADFLGYNEAHLNSLMPGATLTLAVRDSSGGIVAQFTGPGPYVTWFGAGRYYLTFKNNMPYPVNVQITTN
jgi:hypothetical protein